MSSAFTLLLRPSLRQTALRPLPGYTRCFNSGQRDQPEAVADALDVLSEEAAGQEQIIGPVPDLDIDFSFPSLTSSTKENQPPLMNIPPQEDPLLHFLASQIMRNGNRTKASKIVSRTLLNLHAYTRQPPLPLLRHAIFACAPSVRVLNHKHSTKMVHKPIALSEKQGIHLAIRWLLDACQGRQGGPTLEERLAREVILILQKKSGVLEKKETLHKLAMVNRGNMDGIR